MLIPHISDTHGTMPELRDVGRVDLIVHSGDMLPNKTRGTDVEPGFQKDWVIRKRDTLWRWLAHEGAGGSLVPVIFCPGNHDFYDDVVTDPREGMRRIGNPALTRAIEHDPRLRNCQAILCGHCHEQGGREETVCGIKVSNAATTQQLVEVAC